MNAQTMLTVPVATVTGNLEAVNEVIDSFDKVAKDLNNPGHLHNWRRRSGNGTERHRQTTRNRRRRAPSAVHTRSTITPPTR
jgi:hypothetical protein